MADFQGPSDYHDSEIIEFSIDRIQNKIKLLFQTEKEEKKVITISGVTCFRATDIIMQNVVSRIIIFSNNNFSEIDLRQKIIWVTSLGDTESYLSEEKFNTIMSSIKGGECFLLYIEPSWGGEIIIIGNQIEEIDYS